MRSVRYYIIFTNATNLIAQVVFVGWENEDNIESLIRYSCSVVS